MDLTHIAGNLLRMLVMPPASLFLLIGMGALLRRRWPRSGRALCVGGAVALLVLSTNAGALLLVRPLENLTTPLTDPQAAAAQAIVVLGAGSVDGAPEYGGIDVPDQVALVRLQYAARLQHATGLPLLVSGANGEPPHGIMARVLREDFKTPVAWVDDSSRDTAENAANSARILKAAGVRRVLLVTQAMHMPRARAQFVLNGIDVVDAPTLFYARGTWSYTMLVPSASGLYRSYYAMHEWLGMGWYRLRATPPPAAPAGKAYTIRAALIERISSSDSARMLCNVASSITKSSTESACSGICVVRAPSGDGTGANWFASSKVSSSVLGGMVSQPSRRARMELAT
jgi:uncharacterized SAM-binding protein YcdF (DUF218 family)